MKTLILLLLLSIPVAAQDGFYRANGDSAKVDYAAIWSGIILDLTSTKIALKRPGIVEANPLLRRSSVRVASEIGVGGLQSFVVYKLQPKHAKLAFWLSMATSGFRIGVAVRNFRVK